MGEETTGGGGAAQVTINFDINSLNNKLDDLIKSLTPDNKKIIRDCALTLYTNTNFESSNKSPIFIAKDCVDRALILAKELQNRNLLFE